MAEKERHENIAESETLKHLIRTAQCAVVCNTALARMLRGPARTIVQKHTAAAADRLRQLRAEHFICTGEDYTPAAFPAAVTGRLAALRACLERAQRAAGAYKDAADRTGSPILRKMYSDFSLAARAEAREIRQLIITQF